MFMQIRLVIFLKNLTWINMASISPHVSLKVKKYFFTKT